VNEPQGTLFKIQRYALHDGPGIRTTAFFQGCPLRCFWCHNPEGQPETPPPMGPREGSTAPPRVYGRTWTAGALAAELEKDRLFFDESGGGVTFSGGEPLAQAPFLERILEACRGLELHTALDTCGFAAPGTFERAVERADLVLFDLKLVDDDRHRRCTGVSCRPVFDNLHRLDASRRAYRIRIPLVPGLNDDPGSLAAAAALLVRLRGCGGVDILPYHRIGGDKYRRLGRRDPMEGLGPPGPGTVARAVHTLSQLGIPVKVGG
jgi:pyruvate formate lyase activating enzyme